MATGVRTALAGTKPEVETPEIEIIKSFGALPALGVTLKSVSPNICDADCVMYWTFPLPVPRETVKGETDVAAEVPAELPGGNEASGSNLGK